MPSVHPWEGMGPLYTAVNINSKSGSSVLATTKAASYTLTPVDSGTCVEMNSSTATTITVPTNAIAALSVGTVIEVVRLGTGTVTVAPATGVTILSKGGLKSVDGQYGAVSLRKRATDEWVLVGALVA